MSQFKAINACLKAFKSDIVGLIKMEGKGYEI
jgi:hypothetical protein